MYGEDNEKDTTALQESNGLMKRIIQKQLEDNGTVKFVQDSNVVFLLVRGMIERIEVTPDDPVTLGRFEGLSNPTQIDLTPYGANLRGVSRQHAQITVDDNRYYITDLGSTNGTYVRGKRVEPGLPTVLTKGGEFLLGRLRLQFIAR